MKDVSSRIPRNAERFMARALSLARRALGRTDPNPMVGAVIVKSGKIVGEGWHHAPGLPHAEVEAIRSAGDEARGADMFVTLEPCNHHGRTPPCTKPFSMRVSVESASVWKTRTLQSMEAERPFSGRKVWRRSVPSWRIACRRLNEVFITNVTERRPFVYLKLAMSMDGRIATRTGESKWITCEESRKLVHELRNRVTGIMVGVGTILSDNPSLTTRLPKGKGRDPIRIVIDSNLRSRPTPTFSRRTRTRVLSSRAVRILRRTKWPS